MDLKSVNDLAKKSEVLFLSYATEGVLNRVMIYDYQIRNLKKGNFKFLLTGLYL